MIYYFIINPASGSGRGQAVWKTIQTELDRRNVNYRAFRLSGRGEAKKLASSLAKRPGNFPCTLTVVGGDGTINEVINGLTDFKNITFACIPTGSGNDFVRGLALETNPQRALQAVLHPSKMSFVNVGQVQYTKFSQIPGPSDKAFIGSRSFYAVSAGIGFDAAVCNSVLKSRIKKVLNLFHFGKVVYLTTALWQLFTMKRQPLTVAIDGASPRTYQNCYFAAAMNLPYEGGGFKFCPEADPGDGCIDLFLAHDISRLRVLTLLPLAFSGRHVGARGVEIIRCEKAEIKSPEPMCVHTDGEIPGFYDTVTFALCKERLQVILG